MSATRLGVLVLCVGNRDRGDDGFGLAVADRLEGYLPKGTRLIRCSGDVLGLIEDLSSCEALVCVDAAAPITVPGTIHRIDLGSEDLPSDLDMVSSHTFGLTEAITLARALELSPPKIVVFAIEGWSFQLGAPMTPQALQAIGPLGARVLAEVQGLLAKAGCCTVKANAPPISR
ncbi:hydrogenase maturation protease [Novosphingobium sp. ZN18A2]|uniref:hydrogenase maturation protease n=1 Tax=Novosphingobium sp. ZN18A2 TaxID=3079861 RepID=UPI0030D0D2C8